MDDDVFGSSVWGVPSYTSSIAQDPGPSTFTSIAEELTPNTSFTPPPPSTTASSDDQFDDFDDFGTPAETVAGDDDFGDFEDFGDEEMTPGTMASFPPEEIEFRQEVQILEASSLVPKPAKLLELDPMPNREELARRVGDLLGHIYDGYGGHSMTDEPLREREGLDQILVTPESREIYKVLLPSATPPMQPVNWIRSRTRRQHLISLGIPINLDEVLPRSAEKLPAMKISTGAGSVPPGSRSTHPSSSAGNSRAASRAGSPRLHTSAASQFRLDAKPELDETAINGLLDLTTDTMNLSPLSTLEGHLANLKVQTANTSIFLTYLLQERDALQQDSETYNRRIAELVGEAQKIKMGGTTAKSKAASRTRGTQ